MIEFERIKPYLAKLLTLPWKIFFIITFASFIFATIFSLIFSIISLPNVSVTSKPIINDNIVVDLSIVTQTLSDQKRRIILDRNLFNAEGKYPDEDKQSKDGEEEGDQESKLAIKLLGVISGGNLYNGIAIIRNTSNNHVGSYMVDDSISPFGATIVEIYPKRVFLNNNGRREYIRLDEKPIIRSSRIARKGPSSAQIPGLGNINSIDEYKEDGFERVGNNVRLTDTYRQNLLNTQLPQILQDAKAEPHMSGGEIVGWRLINIKKGSIYEKMGLVEGDVVREINGMSLTDAGRAVRTLNSLRNESRYTVQIERGGTKMEKEMNVSQ